MSPNSHMSYLLCEFGTKSVLMRPDMIIAGTKIDVLIHKVGFVFRL